MDDFLMKRALYLATKLNSRDIKKCNCFWVPSYEGDEICTIFLTKHKSRMFQGCIL